MNGRGGKRVYGLQVGGTDHEVQGDLVLLELLGQGLDLALPEKAQLDSIS